jgi:hypothetical protein
MKIIYCPCGQPVLVDDLDFMFVLGLSPWWRLDPQGYARASVVGEEVHMHKAIAGKIGLKGQIDHWNQIKTDNQRDNLRESSFKLNNANKRVRRDSQTQMKGVFPNHDRWMVRVDKKYIGTFDTIEEAGRVYDREALQIFGEFASLNFPQEQNESDSLNSPIR